VVPIPILPPVVNKDPIVFELKDAEKTFVTSTLPKVELVDDKLVIVSFVARIFVAV
jgi:hypothetical protein